jgi:hypothetical protein
MEFMDIIIGMKYSEMIIWVLIKMIHIIKEKIKIIYFCIYIQKTLKNVHNNAMILKEVIGV